MNSIKMGNIFAKKDRPPRSRITDQDRAVLELKKQRDRLRLYQRKIEGEQDKLKELAKRCLREGKKDKAKLIVKKKRRQESLLHKTDQQIDNLERMCTDIEFAQMEINVAQGLKKGNEALKKMHQLMTVEDVERIMDDTREGIEYQRELDQMLAGQFTQADEEDILNELDELLADQQEEIDLPAVPTTKLPEVEQAERPVVVKTRAEPEAMLAS